MTGGNHINLQYHLGDTVIYTSPAGEEYRAVIKKITVCATCLLFWLHDENNIFMVVCGSPEIRPA